MVDTVAHGIFSYLIFSKIKDKGKIWLAVLFGILPDLLSWTVFLIFLIFTGSFSFGRPDLHMNPPDWVFTLYGISHSLIVFAIIFGAVYIFMKKAPIFMLAWPLHILIDIPTHSKDFLPTPFLWPVSSWRFPGISWGTPWFFFGYWTILIFWLVILLAQKLRKKHLYD